MEEKYTTKINVPHYTPKGKEPIIKDLAKFDRYNEMIKIIDDAKLENDELNDFLKYSATRFIEFNFDKIAEYYCHQSKDTQEVMEKLALVIIDFDDAIKNGYVSLSKAIKDIIDAQDKN